MARLLGGIVDIDDLLSDLLESCGDALGRDGKFLCDKVTAIIRQLEQDRERQAELDAGEDW